jgi:ComF family protein
MTTGLNKLYDKAARISETLRDAAVATLYPTGCRVCGGMVEAWRDGVACADCWHELTQANQAEDFCAKCWTRLKSLPSQAPRIDVIERRCGKCDSSPFGAVRACGPYEGALRESVLCLKRRPHIPARLGDALRRAFATMPESHLIESIIPVPLHPERRADRGFNQAEIIARELISPAGLLGPASMTQWAGPRVDVTAVVRIKKTERHRAGLSSRERAASLKNAFRIRAPRLIEGRFILVVDDLITTGGTAAEIARVLLDGGARAVNILSLARAMNEFIQ